MSVSEKLEILSGEFSRLGSHWDGQGVNFALFSAHAERVELCLFDEHGRQEIKRIDLPEKTHGIWHGYIPGLTPGTVYGYRVHGPFEPQAGHRFNPHKLLLDPYARQTLGQFVWHPSHFSYDLRKPNEDVLKNTDNNANWMIKSLVALPLQPQTINRPAIPWSLTHIYETHVKGFTQKHPELEVTQRGKFAGLCDDRIIDYIKSLGITSVELLPIHLFIDEYHLHEKKLSNYWGYNSLNFFTPHQAYHGGTGIVEFQQMVNRLHDAGLEVILDVVYNHTAEGDERGPTLSFKGIDNLSYYHLQADNAGKYVNDTGTGNTVDVSHPRVLQLVMDSLRYWHADVGVDGFRFDLATVLGRESNGFNENASFFHAVLQDPQLSSAKLIAEPWDVGPGGYQLGNFPPGWSEWNDVYRDTVRRFWRADKGLQSELAKRLHGSSDFFEHDGRQPSASINFITSHDGFTLNDLVSYENKHNQANGEDNQDGHNANYSQNFGEEGSTADADIQQLRLRQQRSLLATLLLSQGAPMLLAGDEFGRTQRGNNNAYCQDNDINWFDWSLTEKSGTSHYALIQRLMTLREEFPALHGGRYIHIAPGTDDEGIMWLNARGLPMTEKDWHDDKNHPFCLLLSDANGHPKPNRYLLIAFNNSDVSQTLELPLLTQVHHWQAIINTAVAGGLVDHLAGAKEQQTMLPRVVKVLVSA